MWITMWISTTHPLIHKTCTRYTQAFPQNKTLKNNKKLCLSTKKHKPYYYQLKNKYNNKKKFFLWITFGLLPNQPH